MTKKIEDIPLSEVVAEIRRLAAESPDYIYQSRNDVCVYVEQDEAGKLVGSCIVGKALVGLGADPEALNYPSQEVKGAWAILRYSDGTPQQQNWIDWVQGRQDSGHTWSQSVADADEAYGFGMQS